MNPINAIAKVLALAALSFLTFGRNPETGTPATPAVASAAVAPQAASGPCVPDALTLCLNGGRFQVRVNWQVPSQGTSGVGTGVGLTTDTGYFWFFSPNNIELVLKVVDGRPVNGMFWVFYGALSDVQYTITITDTATGAVKSYSNPQGKLASVADTAAFNGGNAATGADQESRVQSSTSRAQAGEWSTDTRSGSLEARIAAAEAGCTPGDSTLCLNSGRFKVEVKWRVPAQGTNGTGRAVPLTGDTGQFWFFSSNNIELVIKVLDGTPVNGQYWVFYGALSDVEYTIEVTDTQTGYVKTFTNSSGNLASVADTSGFQPNAAPTPTPTPPAPTVTPTPTQPSGTVRVVNVGQGGNWFRDSVSNTSTTSIKVGDTVRWEFKTASYHSTTSGTCTDGGDPYYGTYSTCTPDNVWDSGTVVSPATYSKTFTTAGQYQYYCQVHGSMMTGTVSVNP
jgi:plastocyanin